MFARIGWAGLTGLWLAACAAAPAQAQPKGSQPKQAPPKSAPAPVPPEIEARLEGCEGLPDRARVVRYEPVGEDALYAVTKTAERSLVFPTKEGVMCAVLPTAKPAAKAKGAFAAGGEAIALQAPRCGGGDCVTALAVRGKAERPAAAVRLEASCAEGVDVRPIRLFPGRDSLEVVCRASAGAGWTESRILVDGTGAALSVLHVVDTGSYVALAPDEQRAGACPSQPVGSIRVEQVAERPVLRVVAPPASALTGGKGTLPARQLAWDPKRGEFLPTGAPDLPTPVDAHAGCRRK